MTREKLIEAMKIADKIDSIDSVLRRLERPVSTDLIVIAAAIGKERLTKHLENFKDELSRQLDEI